MVKSFFHKKVFVQQKTFTPIQVLRNLSQIFIANSWKNTDILESIHCIISNMWKLSFINNRFHIKYSCNRVMEQRKNEAFSENSYGINL